MIRKEKIEKPAPIQINTATQFYKGIALNCIDRFDYPLKKAKRYSINGTNQNVWIPNRHLYEDGTIRPDANIDYIFKVHKQTLYYAYHDGNPKKKKHEQYIQDKYEHSLFFDQGF